MKKVVWIPAQSRKRHVFKIVYFCKHFREIRRGVNLLSSL